MAGVWWDAEGVVYWKMLQLNQTVNAELYCQQLARVANAFGNQPSQISEKS